MSAGKGKGTEGRRGHSRDWCDSNCFFKTVGLFTFSWWQSDLADECDDDDMLRALALARGHIPHPLEAPTPRGWSRLKPLSGITQRL